MADVGNIVLTGFMGTGKSVVGRAVADRLGRAFVDTDDRIIAEHGAIADIFESRGEDGFRAIERTVAAELAARDGLVVATGGGMLLDRRNAEALEATGVVICLTADPSTIVRRVGSPSAVLTRPLLTGCDVMARVEALLTERAEGYGRFPSVDTTHRSVTEVADAVIELVE